MHARCGNRPLTRNSGVLPLFFLCSCAVMNFKNELWAWERLFLAPWGRGSRARKPAVTAVPVPFLYPRALSSFPLVTIQTFASWLHGCGARCWHNVLFRSGYCRICPGRKAPAKQRRRGPNGDLMQWFLSRELTQNTRPQVRDPVRMERMERQKALASSQ